MFITFFLGWWGLISFFVTVGNLIGNLMGYVGTITMPAVPKGAIRPHADEALIARLAPHMDNIMKLLNEGTAIADVAREIAPQAGVTPGEVWCVIQKLLPGSVSKVPGPLGGVHLGAL